MAKFSSKTAHQRLLDILNLERNDIYLLVILTFGYGLLGLATPVAVQALVNTVTMGGVMQPLYVISVMLFVLLLFAGLLYIFEIYIVELIQRRIYIRYTIKSGKVIQGIQTQIYDGHNPEEIMNRFLDVSNAQKAAATLLTTGLTAVLQGIVGGLVLMFYSVFFIAVVVFISIALAVIILFLGRLGFPTALVESNVKYDTIAWLETIARGNYLFKFFNAKKRAEITTNQLAADYLDARKTHFRILFKQNLTAILIYAAAGTAMLALGGALVIQGQINIGQFVAAELIIFGVLYSFLSVTHKLEYYYDMLVSLEKLGVVEDLPQETTGSYLPESGQYTLIEMHGISFAYSERVKPINNLSFELSRGQSLAILGASGTGKSTLVELMTGLREPSKGYISAENIDLRQLSLQDYRNHVGMVSKVEFIEKSLLDNLILDRTHVSLDDLHQTLISLDLDKEIANLKDGLDTKVTVSGTPLSTSQAQRLMLVRAVIGKPDLLVIDGLLDNLNRKELEVMLKLLKQNTDKWMLLVTTRKHEIATLFDSVITLGENAGVLS